MTDRQAIVEVMARAMAPDVFRQPRVNLYKPAYDNAYAAAEAALAALDAAGYVVVPKEPTAQMCDAGQRAICHFVVPAMNTEYAYRAMLAASQGEKP